MANSHVYFFSHCRLFFFGKVMVGYALLRLMADPTVFDVQRIKARSEIESELSLSSKSEHSEPLLASGVSMIRVSKGGHSEPLIAGDSKGRVVQGTLPALNLFSHAFCWGVGAGLGIPFLLTAPDKYFATTAGLHILVLCWIVFVFIVSNRPHCSAALEHETRQLFGKFLVAFVVCQGPWIAYCVSYYVIGFNPVLYSIGVTLNAFQGFANYLSFAGSQQCLHGCCTCLPETPASWSGTSSRNSSFLGNSSFMDPPTYCSFLRRPSFFCCVLASVIVRPSCVPVLLCSCIPTFLPSFPGSYPSVLP
jgi:hypothetical protein